MKRKIWTNPWAYVVLAFLIAGSIFIEPHWLAIVSAALTAIAFLILYEVAFRLRHARRNKTWEQLWNNNSLFEVLVFSKRKEEELRRFLDAKPGGYVIHHLPGSYFFGKRLEVAKLK